MNILYKYYSYSFWNIAILELSEVNLIIDFSRYEQLLICSSKKFRRNTNLTFEKLPQIISTVLSSNKKNIYLLMRASSYLLFVFFLTNSDKLALTKFIAMKLNEHQFTVLKQKDEFDLFSLLKIPDDRQIEKQSAEELYFSDFLGGFLSNFSFLTLNQRLQLQSDCFLEFEANGSSLGEACLKVTWAKESRLFVSDFSNSIIRIAKNYDSQMPGGVVLLKNDCWQFEPIPANLSEHTLESGLFDFCWKSRVREIEDSSKRGHVLVECLNDFQLVEFLYFAFHQNLRNKIIVVSENTFYHLSFSVNNFEYINGKLIRSVYQTTPFYVLKFENLVEDPGHVVCRNVLEMAEWLENKAELNFEKYVFVTRTELASLVLDVLGNFASFNNNLVKLEQLFEESLEINQAQKIGNLSIENIRKTIDNSFKGIEIQVLKNENLDKAIEGKLIIGRFRIECISIPQKETIYLLNLEEKKVKFLGKKVFLLSGFENLDVTILGKWMTEDGFVLLESKFDYFKVLNSETLISSVVFFKKGEVLVDSKVESEFIKIVSVLKKREKQLL